MALSAACCGRGSANVSNAPAAAPTTPPNEEVVQEYIPAGILGLLRTADKFEVYSLNKQAWRDWHRDETREGLLQEAIRRLKDTEWTIGSFPASAEERHEVLRNLYVAIGDGSGPRDCFYPTYAIHVQDEQGEAVVLFCSVCGCVVALDSATTTITRRPMPVFLDFCEFMDRLLDTHWIRSSR